MSFPSVFIYRGKLVESRHEAIYLIKDIRNKSILSTNHENHLIYPRSAVKIFQALPFINSKAHKHFNLNNKNIAISCSSHSGETIHINVLKEWIKKTGISLNKLKCGIHNPIDESSSNNLLISGKRPSQLHNNCAGKHLAMINGCLANNMDIKNYIEFDHPYQKLIRNSLEYFMESKIIKKNVGIDGCSVPQYAFPLKNISTSMINLIKEKEDKNIYSNAVNLILNSIKKYPVLIGGHNSFDSDLIKITKGRIFCKGGAEGVFLFADFNKKIGGAIKILDGNNRAIPSITMQILLKLNLLSKKEEEELNNWKIQNIFNHAKKNIGKIVAEIV